MGNYDSHLLSNKDDGQLQADLHVAAARAAFLLPVAEQLVVVARVADKLALEQYIYFFPPSSTVSSHFNKGIQPLTTVITE